MKNCLYDLTEDASPASEYFSIQTGRSWINMYPSVKAKTVHTRRNMVVYIYTVNYYIHKITEEFINRKLSCGIFFENQYATGCTV